MKTHSRCKQATDRTSERTPKTMLPWQLAARIDHTLLKADAGESDIRRVCAEALQWRFASVCTNTCWVPLVAQLLAGSGVQVCAVVAFPLGASHAVIKAQEAAAAVALGATEIDAVVNRALIRAGEEESLRDEARSLRRATDGMVLKLILETSELSAPETRLAAGIAVKEGVDFLKTSTGFGHGGASTAAVNLLREVAGHRAQVKASGGIRDLVTAQRMIDAGADRIGASASVQIMEEAIAASAPQGGR